MKYWVYINDKVDGPFEGDKLVTVPGFTPDTLICSEEAAASGSQEWVKASSVFDFEQESDNDAPQSTQAAAQADTTSALLLAKIDNLTKEISQLHSKLDTMDTHISSVETMLSTPKPPVVAPFTTTTAEQTPATTQESLTPIGTDSLNAHPVQEQPLEEPVANTSIVDENINNKNSAEEELVIRSALDSLYNAKLVEEQQDDNETTFQDLLTPQEAQKLSEQAENSEQETPASQEGKEALLAELTASSQNDVLDQLIKEKEEEASAGDFQLQEEKVVDLTLPQAEEKPAEKETEGNSVLPALAAAAAGVAALSALGNKEEKQEQNEQPSSGNVPAMQESAPEIPQALNSLGKEELKPSTQEEQDDAEATLQELVPNSSVGEPDDQLISDEDLKNAFAEKQEHPTDELVAPMTEDEVPQQSTEVLEQNPANPNDLTEVELKAGSTYLISDFVPPAQAPATGEEQKDEMSPVQEQAPTVNDKTIEVQDMLAEQENQPAESAIQPMEKEADTRSAKRGASFDIKTVPMVAEPADSDRLHVEGLDDVNAQHDVQLSASKPSNATKIIISTLVALALLIALYVFLAFMNLIPAQYNVLAAKEKPAPAAQSSEMLMTEPENAEPVPTDEQPTENPMDAVLAEVQQYALPNGQTLKAYIEATHPTISAELITWEIANAVEPDNYSVLVKVPPEDPQSFKTSYRFNYNAVTQTLDPTISDAKNLLDAAAGGQVPPAAPEQ